jgi:hypothetical protein
MSQDTGASSRRAFFSRGGAALGAGLATTVAGGALASASQPGEPASSRAPSELADRESIRQLQLTFITAMDSGHYGEAAELFTRDATLSLGAETASGRSAIDALLGRYRSQEVPVLHSAYRQSAAQQQRDTVTFREDGRAVAHFQVDVQLCVPLPGDSTAARMARMQGGFAQLRWVPARVHATYAKIAEQWKIASLSCLTA